jgi:Fe2+ or Zn2+ uptake regulation protein
MSARSTALRSASDADRLLIEALRSRGQRVTPQRLLIHRALCELGRHATADEVLAEVSPHLPNASLPTVYATLDLLEELGLVRRITARAGAALYDPRPDHQHLVCRRCGTVEDLDVELDASDALRTARRRGFAPDRAELVVSGLCAGCAGG